MFFMSQVAQTVKSGEMIKAVILANIQTIIEYSYPSHGHMNKTTRYLWLAKTCRVQLIVQSSLDGMSLNSSMVDSSGSEIIAVCTFDRFLCLPRQTEFLPASSQSDNCVIFHHYISADGYHWFIKTTAFCCRNLPVVGTCYKLTLDHCSNWEAAETMSALSGVLQNAIISLRVEIKVITKLLKQNKTF